MKINLPLPVGNSPGLAIIFQHEATVSRAKLITDTDPIPDGWHRAGAKVSIEQNAWQQQLQSFLSDSPEGDEAEIRHPESTGAVTPEHEEWLKWRESQMQPAV